MESLYPYSPVEHSRIFDIQVAQKNCFFQFRITDLRDNGILTEKEFQTKKKKILDRI